MIKSFALLFILFTSCKAVESGGGIADSNTIMFLLLNMQRDSGTDKNAITLIDKKESTGKLKTHTTRLLYNDNYLWVYIYNNKTVVDSMQIEHPLYKHIEYLNADNTFAVLDTVLNEAQFFLRFQAPQTSGQIKIVETLKGKTEKYSVIIKF
jgi:hypothetical protein